MKTLAVIFCMSAFIPFSAYAGATVVGRIKSFQCGDNCYLTIVTEQGNEETGLCGSGPCLNWNKAGSMPRSFVGKKISARLGVGAQYNGENEVAGHMIAFKSLKFIK